MAREWSDFVSETRAYFGFVTRQIAPSFLYPTADSDNRELPVQPPRELAYVQYMTLSSAATGAVIGALLGGRLAGLRYTAENSHPISHLSNPHILNNAANGTSPILTQDLKRYTPRGKKEWFAYFRRKYYYMAYHAIRSSLSYSIRLSSLVAVFTSADALLDLCAQNQRYTNGRIVGRDEERVSWINAPLAGTFTGLAFSLVNRFNRPLLLKATLGSTLMGTIYSLVQFIDLDYIRNTTANENGQGWTYERKYKRLSGYSMDDASDVNRDTNETERKLEVEPAS